LQTLVPRRRREMQCRCQSCATPIHKTGLD
jgi:hypothetical protein